ncbi:hypothetical protein Q9L42_020475 (plasmid) [Methylomarinum sp. Ch1-1]|uniref:DUF4231 domain-containing protein n=1 Tax=Methylomarinum roseum TaxID=3067653 RepID=A0AAU7P0B6_9GAMM|nr:hypothetical protein [Methylomarinum sp. Ch1-1]MDP4523293.1 hypothetical protein [Methylomarinum sp. Ch1-1]
MTEELKDQRPSLLENFIADQPTLDKERHFLLKKMRKTGLRLVLGVVLLIGISMMPPSLGPGQGHTHIFVTIIFLLALIAIFESHSSIALKRMVVEFDPLTDTQKHILQSWCDEHEEISKFVACIERKGREPVQFEFHDMRQWLSTYS